MPYSMLQIGLEDCTGSGTSFVQLQVLYWVMLASQMDKAVGNSEDILQVP